MSMRRESRCSVALVFLSVIVQHSSVLGFTPTSSRATIIRPPLHLVKRSGSDVIGNRRSSFQGKASDKLRLRAADEAAAGDLSNNEEDASTNKNEEETPPPTPGIWPCFDELDSKLIRIALPVIANFAINPLIGRYRTVQCLSGVHLHKKCAHVLHFSLRHSSVL